MVLDIIILIVQFAIDISEGSYVPISAGQMRNRWFPTRIARYAVGQELRDIKDGKIKVELDTEFVTGRFKQQVAQEKREQAKAAVAAAKEAARQERHAAATKARVTAAQRAEPLNPTTMLTFKEQSH